MELNLSLPTSWRDLSDQQLQYICALLAAETYTSTEMKTLCLIRFSGLIPDRSMAKEVHSFIYKKQRVYISDKDIAAGTAMLDWMDTPPEQPVRPSKIGGGTPVNAELHDVKFSTYLMAENFWQGYVKTKNAAILDELACLLVENCKKPLSSVERTAIVLWFSGLKQLLTKIFSDLFMPAGGNAGTNTSTDMRELMDAQIRALTGGDITKEHTVLESDTWRALTELNAKAREAKDLKTK